MQSSITKDSRMQSLIDLYDLHTQFFESVLEGISDADSRNRLGTKANHVAWLAGSLVQQRYDMANDIFPEQGPMHQAAHDLFKDNQGIREDVTYPSMQQYIQDWRRITPVTREGLANASTEVLDTVADIPGMEYTYYQLSTFMMYREANCIGQIALWRRLLGYEAMKYM